MSDELRAKLNDDLLRNTAWDDLKLHAYRGVVFVVRGRAIVDVAIAIAEDDTSQVEVWIGDGTLMRPTADELSRWMREKAVFAALIIQPFVLVQEEVSDPEKTN